MTVGKKNRCLVLPSFSSTLLFFLTYDLIFSKISLHIGIKQFVEMEMLSKENIHCTCDRPKDFYLLKSRARWFKLKKKWKKKVIFLLFLNHHLNQTKQSKIKLGKGKLQPDIGKYLTTSCILLLGKASHEEVSSGEVKSTPAPELGAVLADRRWQRPSQDGGVLPSSRRSTEPRARLTSSEVNPPSPAPPPAPIHVGKEPGKPWGDYKAGEAGG